MNNLEFLHLEKGTCQDNSGGQYTSPGDNNFLNKCWIIILQTAAQQWDSLGLIKEKIFSLEQHYTLRSIPTLCRVLKVKKTEHTFKARVSKYIIAKRAT